MLAVLTRDEASVRSRSCLRVSRGFWPAARAVFARRCFSFFATRALRSSRATFLGSKSISGYDFSKQRAKRDSIIVRYSPALSGTSVIHWSSICLFLPSRPHRLTQSCFSSSQTRLSLFLCCIPFAAANCSHFVGGLGFGKGFALGRREVGAGSWANGPSSEGMVGSEKSAPKRACAPSRANAWRCSSRFSLKTYLIRDYNR